MANLYYMLKKVVIIGPESTGKSTLCKMLSQHYQTEWCPEFAREYLHTNGTKYDLNDLLTIAKGQVALEEKFSRKVGKTERPKDASEQMDFLTDLETSGLPDLLFLDTDMQVMKVWCEYVFNDCHTWILNRIAERKYDLYLLCKPDLPWVQDELREYPNEKPRQELYHIYRDLLIHQHTPWVEISGNYEERLVAAVKAVNELIEYTEHE